MSKGKYTHMQGLEKEILAMREAGATRQEIADCLGLSQVQIKNWINRYNRRQAYEIQRLQMENKLLRDFLQFTERK